MNEERSRGMAAGMSFNRYMVECESEEKATETANKQVLIDTWWNVNENYIIIRYLLISF